MKLIRAIIEIALWAIGVVIAFYVIKWLLILLLFVLVLIF